MYAQLIIVFIILISLFGCVTQETQESSDEELIHKYARKEVARNYKENGTRLLCEQPSYLRCFHISKQQCLSELESSRVSCFEKAWGKLDEKMTDESLEQFGVNHMNCLLDRHFSIHEEKADEISLCLSTFKEDKEQAMKSLLGD